MKKMKLEIDALRVEGFATHAAQGARGTVRGNAVAVPVCDTNAADCDPLTCGPSCIGGCTSNGGAYALADTAIIDPSDRSFIDTCWINTCAGCGTEYMC